MVKDGTEARKGYVVTRGRKGKVKTAPGLGSINADSSPDQESKSGPKWPRSGSRVSIRPIMAWIQTPFYFSL